MMTKQMKIEENRLAVKAQLWGKGESSCLSIAISKDLKVLTDDRDARKLAQKKGCSCFRNHWSSG